MHEVGDLGPFADPAMVRRLLDDGIVLFVGFDGTGTITWMGGSAITVLGRPAHELVGTSALDLIHPDDQEVLLDSLAETARNSTERILAVLRVASADGTWRVLEFGGIDLRDTTGEGTFLVWGRDHGSAVRLFDFLGSLLNAHDLPHLLGQVLGWCDALKPFSASVALARADDGTYRTMASSEPLPAALGTGLVVDAETVGPWQLALGTPDPVEAGVRELSDVLGEVAVAGDIHAGWVVSVPGVGTEPPDGLLVTWRTRPGPMLITHARHLREAARLCQLAFAWARVHTDLVVAARTDSLTQLANRSRLRELAAGHHSSPATVLYCDLDGFKGLNDRWGHGVGDQVLREVAARMRPAVRAGDLLVRLGGDEFVVWCPGLQDRRGADELARRILDRLARPIEVAGRHQSIGCSIGIACAEPRQDGSLDLDALLECADRALYRAKAAGRGQIAHHDDPPG